MSSGEISLKNITLKNISKNDFDSILDITSTPEIMENIGNGLIWGEEKVKRFIYFCIKEAKEPPRSRTQYYYKIVSNDYFLGIIGFHTFYRKELPTKPNDFYLTVYMSQKYQGRGIYSIAMNLLLEKMKQLKTKTSKLHFLVRNRNNKMIQISRNKYRFMKEITLNNEKFSIFVINVNTDVTRKSKKRTMKTMKPMKNKSSKKLSRGNKKSKKTQQEKFNYYLTSTKNISQERIDNLLKKRGNWIKYPISFTKYKSLRNTPKLGFLFIDRINNEQKQLQSYPAVIKNFIDEKKNNVGRKNELYKNLGKIVAKNPKSSLSKYLLEQYNFDWLKSYETGKIDEDIAKVKSIFEKTPNKIWIYKPVAGYHGINIKIFKSFDEFNEYIKEFIKSYSPIWDNPKNKLKQSSILLQNNWVLQEYIEKPLLFENKKIHIRPIFIYCKFDGDNNKYGYILDRILVAHALENYKFDDFNNPRIHDTHFSSTTTGRIYFQEDFEKKGILSKEQINDIENQVKDLATYVFDEINAKCFAESDVCYEPLGIDLMIDEPTLTIKLLEVQITRISYGFFDDDRIPRFSNIFEYVLENSMERVVDKVFPPKNKFENSNGFIKFYQKVIK